LIAALFGCCLGLVTLLSGFQSARMGLLWRPGIVQAGGMLVCCLVLGTGLYFAVLANRRDESPAGLCIFCFTGNGVLLVPFLLAGALFSLNAVEEANNIARNEEQKRIEAPKREHDRKNIRLRLTYEPGPDWLNLAHLTWKDEFNDTRKMGSAGVMNIGTFPQGLKLNVAWPEARRFDLTIDLDSEDVNLMFEVVNIREVTAWKDEKEIELPIDLAPGKHHIVIKGRCP
jgi:hypothetical protein